VVQSSELGSVPVAPPTRKHAAPGAPQRFVSLDALRGVAALAVVFWHWQNFFYHGTTPGSIERSAQPLYSVFFVFYEKGWMAVDIFFSLSGFIFFWLYSERVTRRAIAAWEFLVLRVSRLYPLHLLTLVIVAVLQWQLFSRTGDFFVYSFNDAYHFVLNLLFVSAWRTSFGDSFNAPVWSVSVEMFLYGVFFLLCRLSRPTWPRLLVLILMGALLKFFIPIGRGLFSFFIGGATYYIYAAVLSRGHLQRDAKAAVPIAVVGWLLAAVAIRLGAAFGVGGTSPIVADRIANLLATGFLMPFTILTLAMLETARPGFGHSLSFLGDISYSSYMLHFPLQLAAVSVLGVIGVGTAIFYSTWTLLAFFAVLIAVSLLSYHYVERPAQRALRRRWAVSARAWRAQP
jgi:peptidoglycan/LPS O-acetylase OafA/YrhL